jgi:hypothetical protein
MATFSFELIDKISSPATQAEKNLELLTGGLKDTDKAIGQLNRSARQLRLGQLAGTDITKQQRAATQATLRRIQADRLRLSIQRDTIRQGIQESQVTLSTGQALLRSINPAVALRSRLSELNKSLRDGSKNGGLFRAALSGTVGLMGSLATGAVAAGAGFAALAGSVLASAAHMSDLRASTMSFL